MTKKRILRVKVDSDQIRKLYTIFSKFYGLIEISEKRLRKKALKLLDLKEDETILEIGFGRGSTLVEFANSIGDKGEVYGIDLTPEMVKLTNKRLLEIGLSKKVKLYEGDAKQLPFIKDKFDAVFIASTLELFDTPEIPVVLNEIRRVLKPTGRLCVVSIPKKGRENSLSLKLYEWFFKTFPKLSTCRPIYIENSLKQAGFRIKNVDETFMNKFFPMKIVIANPK